MQVIRLELVSREILRNGRCFGRVRLIGDGGESILVDCNVPFGGMARLSVNGALAQDAMRQLRRMPEFRCDPPELAEFALPAPRKRRVLALSA